MSKTILGADFAKCITELLNSSNFGLDAVIKELPQKMNLSLNAAELTKAAAQTIQLDCSEMIDTAQKALSSSLPLLSETMKEAVAEQLSTPSYMESIRDIALSTLDALDLEEPEKFPEIPAEKLQPALDEVERRLPKEAAEVVNAKVAKSKTEDNKISLGSWIEIVGILVTILLFLAEQALSSEHDKKEEAYWAATNEYQQESLELQREDVSLKKEILDYFKDLQGNSFGTNDVSEDVCDPVDSQTETENHEAVQNGQQKKSETEE